jgi:GNAT superfamily N-acetyltransferase
MWDGVPVHFSATLPQVGSKRHRRFTRIVTLPDYQGLGIGMRIVAAVAELERSQGNRVSVTSSHPALIGHCRRSPLWKATSFKKTGTTRSRLNSKSKRSRFAGYRSSAGRAVVSFEFVGQQSHG